MTNSIVFNEHWNKVTPRYPDRYFDFAVCDIPYGIDVCNMAFTREVKTTVKQKNGSRISPKKKQYQKSDWDREVPDQAYFDELRRISKHQVIFGVDYVNWNGLGQGRIIWDKCVPDGVSFKGKEVAYCSVFEDSVTIKLLWHGMMQAKSLSEPTIPQGDKRLNEKRTHPTHKPVLLYDAIYKIIGGFSGMKVIDTHLGDGSNRISCTKNAASDFVGCEIGKYYFDNEQIRYKQFMSQLRLFPHA